MSARVLFISYYFPPDGGPGTQRVAKFCKYIWRHGWAPTVLTRTPPATRGRWDPEDASLLREIPSTAEVVRVDARDEPQDWARALAPADTNATLGWAEAAFERAATLVRENRIDLVFITMSPFDLAHLGRRLQTQCDVPVVYDLRDPWALDGWRTHRRRRDWRRDVELMRSTLAQADGVIANTPDARAAIIELEPSLDPARVVTITNGYDDADFLAPAATGYRRDPAVFRLMHMGSLHAGRALRERGLLGSFRRRLRHSAQPIDPTGRTLIPLLNAIARLKRQKHPVGRLVRLELAGLPDAADQRCVCECGLEDQVQWLDYLPHREAVLRLQQADALFLPLHDIEPGRRSLIVPGKTYEYLAAGRPILAALPTGDARELIETHPMGYLAPPCDAPALARQLALLHDAWAAGAFDDIRTPPGIGCYQRRQLAARLAECFDYFTGRQLARAA